MFRLFKQRLTASQSTQATGAPDSATPHDQPSRRAALAWIFQSTWGWRACQPLAVGSAVLGLSPVLNAWAANTLAVRLWPGPDYTRLTIESDSPLKSKLNNQGDKQLVIDLPGMVANDALRSLNQKVLPSDPYIQSLQVLSTDNAVQLVISLKQAVKTEHFVLSPVANYKYRLVFDMNPLKAADPLLQLIRAKTQLSDDVLQDFLSSRQAALVRQEDEMSALINQSLNKAKLGSAGASAPQVAAVTPGKPSATANTNPNANAASKQQQTLEKARGSVNRLIIVAIDPGHGGEDPGAIGPGGSYEKTAVLAIGLRLRELINAIPGMQAVMTRDGDYFVPLAERVRKAQRVQADLFVSIHADAVDDPRPRGASVYALNTRGATSATARLLQSSQNASDLIGGVSQTTSHDRQLVRALADMATTAQIKDSTRLGQEMLRHVSQVGQLHKKNVEFANFAVLRAPDIPSLLVETAFISNPQEEAQLNSTAYREQMAQALSTGIRTYFVKNPPMRRTRIA